MKTKQLIIPILLLALSACKKEQAPGGATNATLKGKVSINGRSFADSTALYKISSVASTYTPSSIITSHLEQANYSYGADGRLSNILVTTNIKRRGIKRPGTDSLAFDTVSSYNTNWAYTYGVNTVTVKYQSSIAGDYWKNTYVLDSQGKVVKDTIRIFTASTNDLYIDPRVYTYATVNTVAKTVTITEPGFLYRYNLTNDNLSSELSGNSTPNQLEANYVFNTNKASQPADALSLNQQLWVYGYPSITSKNLSQSASASTNPTYTPFFTLAYGIDNVYGGCIDVQFAYEFDGMGRISKITETGRTSTTTPYKVLRTRVITYVNN